MFIVQECETGYDTTLAEFDTFAEAREYAQDLLTDMEDIGYQIVHDLMGTARYAVAQARRGDSMCELVIAPVQ